MKLLSTSLLFFLAIQSFAGGNVFYSKSSLEKTPYNNQWMPDKNLQAELRAQSAWQNFLQQNGDWWVLFNEDNRKPHRAYGKPIVVTGSTAEDKARNFIQTKLNNFRIPVADLVLQNAQATEKHTYVNFYQKFNGVKVLESRLTVKLDASGRVILFGADVYSDIQVSTTPAISTGQAGSFAMADITEAITSTVVNPELFILPVPENRANIYKLVYQVNVKTLDNDGIPSDFYTLVDAVSGEILYRSNMVKHMHNKPEAKKAPAGVIEVISEGQVYTTHSYNPATTELLANLEFTIGASTFNTDVNGYVSTGIAGPQTGTFFLRGLWSVVKTNNVTPQMTANLVDGTNTVVFSGGNIKERSAYYHVNIVHDHCKQYMPTFTGMDFALPTNVDVTGTCNAFYNGTSINFYAQGGGCTSFATVGDVVYHEYGHGINDNYYQSQGGNFVNGAMGEGYADFWAYTITENPVLGYGTDLATATEFIRRYDENRKVYPVNIVGEVHSDGEIIAGAWWDTYLNLGNDMPGTLALFVEAYAGLQAQAMNGNEGKAYTDVLIDVLQADDTDADLTNGTPNGQAIVDAFYLHGITLISNGTITHTPVSFSASATPVTINATLNLNFPYTDYLTAVKCFYKINTGAFTSVNMTNVSGNNYTVDIPSQPNGTVIPYYLGAEDINGSLSNVIPIGASGIADMANLPYYVMVGYQLEKTDDNDNLTELGTWQTGLGSDNNTTGDWSIQIPMGSYSTAGDTSTVVAPYYQHTSGGDLCFVTANAASASDAVGTADVDAGHTTLQSANINLTAYTNPTFSYWRWYTNAPATGANPGADWWQVSISGDGGTSWVPVENVKASSAHWRRVVFRVSDYVTPTATVKLKFVASDSTHLGLNLDGGSLVEAAVDDIQLWDELNSDAVEEVIDGIQYMLSPNPANEIVNVMFELPVSGDVKIDVVDVTGKLVKTITLNGCSAGITNRKIDLAGMENGIYQVVLTSGGRTYTRKLVLTR